MPKIVNEKDKADSNTISLPRSTWSEISSYLEKNDMTRADFFRAAVAEKMSPAPSSAPDALSPTIIEDLARKLCGEVVANRIETKMQSAGVPYSQANLLKALLDGLDRFFEGGGYFPTDEESYDSTPWVVNSTYLPLHALLAPAVVVAERNAVHFQAKAKREEGLEAALAADAAQRWERRRNRAMAALKGMNDAIDRADPVATDQPAAPRKRVGVPQPQQPSHSSQGGMSASA